MRAIPPFSLLLAASLALLPHLTLADSPSSPSSRRETALTGPYSGPSPSLEEDTGASDLLWSDIPAVQLGRGLQPPHRWKEFLPHHSASEQDSVKVVLARSQEERRRLREVDDGPRARRKEDSRRREVGRGRKQEEEWEGGDEEDDDDDDDDDEQQENLASARDRKRQKNDQDRQAMGHLKSKAKKEAKKAWKSAKHAAHVVAHPQQAARANSDDDSSASSSSIPLMGAITTLYRLTLSTLSHLYRLTTLLTRYALHAITLVYRSTAYALRMAWRAWLAVWASGRYVTRQTLRPVRVVMAPVIYIWLGVRFVVWDVPSYYVKGVLREVYPLYVFLGAALALGTCIGLGCALFLWLGSLITRDSSPLENHLDAWRQHEVGLVVEKQRLGFERDNEKVVRQWEDRERRRRKGKGKEREGMVMGRDTSRRSGARRRVPASASTGMDPWDREETLGSALDSSSSPLDDDDDHDTNGNGAGTTPSYLRGLGKEWRPLPKGMAHSLAQRVASASSASAAESDEGESGESREMEDQEGEWSYASGSGSGHGMGMGSYGSASGSGSYMSQPQRRGSAGSLPAAAAAWRTPTSRGGQEEGDDYFSVARGGAPGITRAVPLESPLSYAAAAGGGGDGYVRSASSTPQAHAPLGATGRRSRSRRSGEYAGSAGGTGSASTTPGSTGAPLQSPLLSLSQLAGGTMSSSREQQAALSSPEASTRNRRGAQGGIVAR